MSKKLTIGYFYRKDLNLYGDTGNVEVLYQRAKRRDINVSVLDIDVNTNIAGDFMKNVDIVFMGGGPDSGQKNVYEDFLNNKGPYLKNYINNDGVGLFICGAYQLLGHYYKSADGSELEGLGIYNMYTQHFGRRKPRCVGNVIAKINPLLSTTTLFRSVNFLGDYIVGFGNHGGRSFLAETVVPLATVEHGCGNNGEDSGEGVLYGNTFGTYFHGPFLSRNAHIADYLIAKSLGLSKLDPLDDDLIKSAYTVSLKLK